MGREEWLAERKKGIGGSDWTHILGIEPYGCARRCWYDKTGVEPDYPMIETGVLKRGQKLERLVIEEFVEVHQRAVWYPDDSVNAAQDFEQQFGFADEIAGRPRPEWWIGTPDAAILPIDPTSKKELPLVGEVKTKGPWTFAKVRKDGVPVGERAQMQHYLGLTGWRGATGLYFEPCTWSLLPLPVDRDEQALSMMLDAGHEFWNRVLQGEGHEPHQLDPRSRQCRDCPWFPTCQGEWEWDGEEDTGDYERTDDPQVAEMVRERIEIAAVKKDAEQMLDKINESLVSLVGAGKKVLTADDHKVRISDGSYTTRDYKPIEARWPKLWKRIVEIAKVKRKGDPSVYIYPKRKEADNG